MRTILTLITLMALTGLAFAADIPQPDANAGDFIKALFTAATNGEWKIVAGLVMIGFVFVLRTWGSKYVKWFASSTGGTILNFTASLGATLGVALASGAPIKLGLVATAFSTAATAAGLWELLKKYVPGVDRKNEKTKASAGVVDPVVNP